MATFTVFYDINGVSEPGKPAGVKIKVRHGKKGKRIFNPEVAVAPEDWDEDEKKVRRTHPNHIDFNLRIQETVTNLRNQYERAMRTMGFWDLSKVEVTLDEETEDEEIKAVEPKKEYFYFTDYWQDWINDYFLKIAAEPDNEELLTIKTIQMYQSSLNKFREFQEHVLFTEVTVSFMKAYEKFLKDYQIPNKRGKVLRLSEGRCHDIINHVKIMFREGIRDGHIGQHRYIFDLVYKCTFKPKRGTGKRRDLEPEELQLFRDYVAPENKPHLQLICDGFLFTCMTGLTPGDLANLDHTWIKTLPNGIVKLDSVRGKTGIPIKLPLSTLFDGEPLKILRKYLKGDERPWGKTNQHFNREVKKVAAAVGLPGWDKMHMYVGRHTFANLLIDAGLDIVYIQKLLAHTKISTTQIYAKYKERAVFKAVDALDWAEVLQKNMVDEEWKSHKAFVDTVRHDILPPQSNLFFFPADGSAVASWVYQGQPCSLLIRRSEPQLVETDGETLRLYIFQEGTRHLVTFIDANGEPDTYADIPNSANEEEINLLAMRFLEQKLLERGQILAKVISA